MLFLNSRCERNKKVFYAHTDAKTEKEEDCV